MSVLWSGLRVARRIHDSTWDQRIGIRTTAVAVPLEVDGFPADACPAVPSPYALVNRVLRLAELCPDDVFVDVGCGSGRVVCCAARYPIRSAQGVELLPDAAKAAQQNLLDLRGRRALHCSIHQGNVLDYDYSDATVLFLFNPFGEETMQGFLEVLTKTMSNRRGYGCRPLRLVYYNPVFRDLLLEVSPWVARTEHHVILQRQVDVFSSSTA